MRFLIVVLGLAGVFQAGAALAGREPQVASLDQALHQMLPNDWTVEYAPSIDPQVQVSYRPTPDFRRSLYTVRGGEGYRFFILSHQNTLMVFRHLEDDDEY